MKKLNVGSLTLSLAALCALPSLAQAQEAENRGDEVRLHLGTGIGVGGELENDVEELPDWAEGEDDDMAVTPNLHVGIEVPLHTNFTLGGEVSLAFWNTEDRVDPPAGYEEGDAQIQLDVLARPKVRFNVLPALELYGVLPVGFTYYFPNDRDGGSVEFEGGPGFAVGGAAGATYFFTQSFGVTAELGYLYRKFHSSGKSDVPVSGITSSDIENSFGQFQMNAGVTFAF